MSFCASCPCYILSWWRRSRGSCGTNGRLSIYIGRLAGRLVSSSRLLRLVFLLVPPSRGSVSLFVLSRAFRLVVLRWRLVSFCPCVLFIVRLVGAAYVVGVSCRLFASCLVSPIGLFRLSRLVVSLSWRVAARVGRGRRGRRRWCSLVVMRCCGGGVPAPVFSICSAGVGR